MKVYRNDKIRNKCITDYNLESSSFKYLCFALMAVSKNQEKISCLGGTGKGGTVKVVGYLEW